MLANRDARDGAGQNIVEHQGGDGQLGAGATHGFLHHPIHTAPREHRVRLHIHRTHGIRKEHHPEDEPWGRLPNGLLRNTTDIECRRAQIVQDNSGGAPERVTVLSAMCGACSMYMWRAPRTACAASRVRGTASGEEATSSIRWVRVSSIRHASSR